VYDAAIIGAGPAGNRLAYRLADRDYSVIVLEKKKDAGEPVCCTGILGRECIERFAIDSSVVYREAYGASVVSPSGKLLRVRRSEPQAAIVNRAAFNSYSAGLAVDRGAEYRLENRVTNIVAEPDRVVIETGHDRMVKDRVEARVAVIACGYGSGLAEAAGLGKPGDFAMGAQAEVETDGVEEIEVYLGGEVAPGFFAWLVPTAPGRALAGLITRRDTSRYMDRLLSMLVRQGKVRAEQPEVRYAGLALDRASRTSGNRLLVVGSAAGQVKPVTGGGVYYGMLCADIAAESLFRAFKRDDLTAASLANYDRQWKKVLGREIKLGCWSRKFYERLSDRRIDTLVDIIKNNGIDKALAESNNYKFDWHGAVILNLVRQKALSGMFKSVKLPFSVKEND
jgi:digeranylgeranylglycerophospholipid reductase